MKTKLLKARFARACGSAIVALLLLSLPVDGGQPLSAGEIESRTAAAPQVGRTLSEGIDHLAERARPLLDRYGYAALFLCIFVEGFGIPAPGQSLLILASLESVSGRLSIYLVLMVALLAAAGGNSVGYLIGRWGGKALRAKGYVNEARLFRVQRHFVRRGAAVLIVARFLDGFRQLNGIAAGMLGMSWPRFSLFNTLGALLWTMMWGLGVFLLDRRVADLHIHYSAIQLLALAGALTTLTALIIYVMKRGKARQSAKSQQ